MSDHVCQYCGQPIEWDTYWTVWDHIGSQRKVTAELCYPELGLEKSTMALP